MYNRLWNRWIDLRHYLSTLTDDPRPPLLCCAVDCVREEDLTQLSRQLRTQAGAGPELVAALLVAARSVHRNLLRMKAEVAAF